MELNAPVVDVSVSGLALATSGAEGERWRLRLALARFGDHEVDAIVRWSAGGMTGLELVDLSPESARAVQRYVAELLERGAAS